MSKRMPSGSVKSSSASKPSSSVKDYLDSFRQNILPPLKLPPLERYPSFFELAGETQDVKVERRRGLFESLISDPRVMFYDLLDAPESFEPGVSEALQEMLSGRKFEELTPDQQELLNRAVFDFAEKKVPVPKKTKPRLQKKDDDEDEEDEEEQIPEMPQGPTFWWRH